MSPVPKKSRLEESTDSLAVSDDGFQLGFIRYEVAVSDITASPDGINSPVIEVLGLPWYLKVKKEDDGLDAYLYHRSSDCDMWSIDASIDFKIVNIDGVIHEGGKVLGTYNCKKDSWGMDVIKWEDAINEEKGFIKDGKIIIEARFKLSNLVGIRTNPHIDFSDPNEPFHDVVLVINGEKVYASKQILAIHSSHFKALFYGVDAEKNKEEFELKDIDRKEFIAFLNLIYPSCTKISVSNAEYLLKLSDLFQIKTIIDQVENFLIDSSKFKLHVKLNLSDKYKLVKLQEHCLKTFKNINDITKLQADGFDLLSRNVKATLMEKVMKLGNSRQVYDYDDLLMPSDDGSPLGFIRFEVAVSDITYNGIFSPIITVLGLPWKVKVKKIDPSSLGVFLYHRSSDSDIWSFDIAQDIMLINNDVGKNICHKHRTVTFNHNLFHGGCSSSCGLSKWEDIVNEEKGFIKDGKITVACRFLLSNFVGIRLNAYVDFTSPNEPFHDVALMIEGQKIYVSKQVLAIHSPVFKTMFYRDFTEKNKEMIELKDVDREVFLDMLKLIYPSYKKINDDNAESLLKLADQFQIKTIIDQVEKFLINSTKLNIPAKLNLSEQYRLVTLQENCLGTFKTVNDIMSLKTVNGYEDLSGTMKGILLDRAMKLN